jgi:hypothetical protein
VHVFEEDTAEGAVYRPENSDIPLSRRPRERLTFEPDGRAGLYLQGPDDRYVEQPATWRDEGGALVIRVAGGGPVLRIVERSPTRLVIQPERPPTKAHKA